MEKDYKYVIVTPRQQGGGPIVLHVLCQELCKNGKEARVFYPSPILKYERKHRVVFWLVYLVWFFWDMIKNISAHFLKVLGVDEKFGFTKKFISVGNTKCKRKYLPFLDDNTIVVYPEVYYGNFLGAQNVVRWFLSYSNYMDCLDKAYNKDDLFFSFREIFNIQSLNPTCRLLSVVYFDFDLYRQYNYGKRKGKAYIIRKGKTRNDLPSRYDGIIIDNLSEKDIVKVFNECKYCISYDTQTAYSDIASICGCISIVVPENGKTQKDYRDLNDVSLGVSFGFRKKDIQKAIDEREILKKTMELHNKETKRNVKDFIQICEKYFENR